MADPGALASVFIFETVREFFEVKTVIGVVDAVLFEDCLDEVPEAGRQLAVADLILLNKAAMVTEDYVHALEEKIKNINPLAQVLPTNFGEVTLAMIDKASSQETQLFTFQAPESHEHSDMKSILLDFENIVFDLGRLRSVLTVSLFLHYHQIYRIKGFVRLSSRKQLHLVQSVGQQLSISPVLEEVGQKPFLVVIGKGLTRKGIEKLFAKGYEHEGITL